MDTLFTRLEEASHAGDVNSLKELLMKDKLLLEKVIGRTSMRDNPLHIAAMVGHADFVREVIHHKPDLAVELNDHGLSPLHLAAAHGHLTVVKELWKADLDLCLISEPQEGLLPLHIAVKKRRTAIVKELVEACEEAVHKLTNSRETILHLAVKYNSFNIIEFLIDRVHDLNAMDDRGNTILHLAVASKQLPVIRLLLSKSTIDVNSKNLVSLTPLDVLLISRLQNGDLFVGEMIRGFGGKTAAELGPVIRDSVSTTSPLQPHYLGTINKIEEVNLGLQKQENEKESEKKKEKKNEKEKEKKYDPKILLLVSTLVATVTFQAALNPPGGFKSDDTDDGIIKGQPVLITNLDSFLTFDMFALFSSVSVMMLLLCVVPRKKKLVMKLLVWVIWGATFSMGLAFTRGISVLYDYGTGREDNWYSAVLLSGWLVLLRLGISWVLVRFLIFLLKKSVFWEPVRQCFVLLKTGCSSKWQQLNESNCFEFFKMAICIVLILGVLAVISFPWVLYKFTKI